MRRRQQNAAEAEDPVTTAPAAAPETLEQPAARNRAPPEPVLTPWEPTTETPDREQQQQQLFALAKSLGFACQNIQGLRRDFAQMLFSRLTNRLGKAVYQTVYLVMSMPRMAAEQMFPSSLLTTNDRKNLSWEATTMASTSELLGDMLDMISPMSYGVTRAVQPPSERVARVFAVIMPTVEVSHAVLPHGAERLFFQCQYVLFDNHAEINPPKNAQRREVALDLNLQAALRQQVLQDVFQLSEKNLRLSAAWWRQLGREDMALEVEAGHITKRQRERAAARAALPVTHFNVECILREVPTAGAAKIWFLVRWEGYDPTWETWRIQGEVGSALETWEPLAVVRRTMAYRAWEESKVASSQQALA